MERRTTSKLMHQRFYGKNRGSFVIKNGVVLSAELKAMSTLFNVFDAGMEVDGASSAGVSNTVRNLDVHCQVPEKTWKSGEAVLEMRTKISTGGGNMNAIVYGMKHTSMKRKGDDGVRKVRKRRKVSVGRFVLFKDGKVKRPERREEEVSRAGLSEKQMFARTLSDTAMCKKGLESRIEHVPFFRSCSLKRMNHRFVAMSTARMVKRGEHGIEEKCAVVALTIEEESKRIRTVVMKREGRKNSGGDTVNEVSKCICSCEARWGWNGMSESSCWHLDALKANCRLMDEMNNLVDSGLMENG